MTIAPIRRLRHERERDRREWRQEGSKRLRSSEVSQATLRCELDHG
jgi:hypothetical protein